MSKHSWKLREPDGAIHWHVVMERMERFKIKTMLWNRRSRIRNMILMQQEDLTSHEPSKDTLLGNNLT